MPLSTAGTARESGYRVLHRASPSQTRENACRTLHCCLTITFGFFGGFEGRFIILAKKDFIYHGTTSPWKQKASLTFTRRQNSQLILQDTLSYLEVIKKFLHRHLVAIVFQTFDFKAIPKRKFFVVILKRQHGDNYRVTTQTDKANVINSTETRFVGFWSVSYLVFRCGDRLRKSKEGQGKVYKTILEGLQFLISLNDLKYPQMK